MCPAQTLKGSRGCGCETLIGKIKWLCIYFLPCIYTLSLLGSLPRSNWLPLPLPSPPGRPTLQVQNRFPWCLVSPASGYCKTIRLCRIWCVRHWVVSYSLPFPSLKPNINSYFSLSFYRAVWVSLCPLSSSSLHLLSSLPFNLVSQIWQPVYQRSEGLL